MNPFLEILALACLAAGLFSFAVIRFRHIRRDPVLRKASLVLLAVFPLAVAGVVGIRFPNVPKGWEPFSAVSLFGVVAVPLFFLFGSRAGLEEEIRSNRTVRRLFLLAVICLAAAFLIWLLLAERGVPIFP